MLSSYYCPDYDPRVCHQPVIRLPLSLDLTRLADKEHCDVPRWLKLRQSLPGVTPYVDWITVPDVCALCVWHRCMRTASAL
jgi:hypothetical protein